jgi:hypothetical protein
VEISAVTPSPVGFFPVPSPSPSPEENIARVGREQRKKKSIVLLMNGDVAAFASRSKSNLLVLTWEAEGGRKQSGRGYKAPSSALVKAGHCLRLPGRRELWPWAWAWPWPRSCMKICKHGQPRS